ncbi:hypothetical protein ACFPK1_15680 [Actinomycetospora rhizophila]|uniref:ABM domain-containing protein n=1 Tax=Actinomycetospora rhizophila TaxID=1416876 RepID=A0ABV9ZGD3_9PSEU
MYARHTFATGDPAMLDDAVTATRVQGHDLLSGQPGFAGMSVFVDAELGKLLIGSFWDSEESCRASDETVREQRAKLLLPFAATLGAEIFEVALAHQVREPGPGSAMRRLVVEFDPSESDVRIEAFRAVTPSLDAIPGFCRSTLFIDRARGRAVVGSIYADRAALVAARSATAGVRERAGQHAGAPLAVRSLEEFDTVFYGAPSA